MAKVTFPDIDHHHSFFPFASFQQITTPITTLQGLVPPQLQLAPHKDIRTKDLSQGPCFLLLGIFLSDLPACGEGRGWGEEDFIIATFPPENSVDFQVMACFGTRYKPPGK